MTPGPDGDERRPHPTSRTPAVVAAGALLAVAALAAYRSSLSGPFVFDDELSIGSNATIRHLWPVWTALSPPHGGLPVSGRPVVNLSFALNYALGGMNVWGYHAANLTIHILAGLTLFGVVRRTLARDSGMGFQPMLVGEHGPALRDHATVMAFAIALLWLVHPLQTESVTYISQRAESLMGLFYLLTLYCFVRGAEETESTKDEGRSTKQESAGAEPGVHRRFVLRPSYFVLSVFFCLLGMATKEVMVSAPLIVLLYDRTFISGTFGEAWRRRRAYYLGLACTWLPLGWLVAETGGRGGSAGFATAVPWWVYAVTQLRAIAHYLRLSVWPHPLVFDYGRMLGGTLGELVCDGVLVVGLAAAAVWGLFGGRVGRSRPTVRSVDLAGRAQTNGWARPPNPTLLGFLSAFFFAILAPTSLVPVATETVAEHRMYLPLAAVIAALVWGIFRLLRPWGAAGLCMVLAIALGVATSHRNEDYLSDIALWSDTVAKMPENPDAHNDLGVVQFRAKNFPAAIVQYEQALRLEPGFADTHRNLGLALAATGRLPAAVAQFDEALRLKPGFADAQANLADAEYELGNALAQTGRQPEAIAHYERAVTLRPGFVEARVNLGNVLLKTGRIPEAVSQYREALRLRPGYADAQYDLGLALRALGRP